MNVFRIFKREQTKEEAHAQLLDRYSSAEHIWQALKAGRRLSLLDSHEFKCSEFHTQITYLRARMAKRCEPYTMRSEWVLVNGKRMKRYWLEAIEDALCG